MARSRLQLELSTCSIYVLALLPIVFQLVFMGFIVCIRKMAAGFDEHTKPIETHT